MLSKERSIEVAGLLLPWLLAGCAEVTPPPALTCDDALTRCNDDNECTFDDCDSASGECLYANASDGTTCEFEGGTSTCQAGVCGFSPDAVTFCEMYETVCGFGSADRYENESDCRMQFDEASDDKKECVTQHLGFAGQTDPATHCPHAAGASPCDL